ncbi:hypothetical protein AB0M80_22525 [Amycolatopsis sp. NPDC051045]|uniref:hypothetical protein n=1 Tax=Amycolatopsis sp. NPDC051045 TaxID=3156922 RepID=UPI00341D8035
MGASGDRGPTSGDMPMNWHRTSHLGYVRAVARELNELRIRTQDPKNSSTKLRRAASLWMLDWEYFPWIGPCDVWVGVEWDEEFGWTVNRTDEINAGPCRGRAEARYGIGLGVVPEAAEAALRIGLACESESDFESLTIARQLRRADIHDPHLEAELAAHLPANHS